MAHSMLLGYTLMIVAFSMVFVGIGCRSRSSRSSRWESSSR
jgi:hypothetical protein